MITELCYIYKIENILNKKCYVGSTINIEMRWKTHRKLLKGNGHHSKKLQYAWNKYGEINFKLSIVCVRQKSQRDFQEAFWMARLKSFYNATDILIEGKNYPNRLTSLTTREKLKFAALGKKRPEQVCKNIGDSKRGKKWTELQRKNLSLVRKGRLFSEETRRKIGEKHKGKIISEEQRKNLSKLNLGKKHTLEAKQKISEALKVRVIKEETRKKLSLSSKGRIPSEETRKKMSEAAKMRKRQKLQEVA